MNVADDAPVLSAQALSVVLNGRPVVAPASFQIAAGEFVTIVGPNGAGKTSLLRALAGLQSCAGELSLNGHDAASLTVQARARAMAYLPQDGSLHWPMRVRDVVALGRLPFAASLQRLSEADTICIDTALQDCGVMHLAGQRATEISGGELSRVLLARVLASDSPLLLLDEPTASLDPAHQIAIMQMLARAARRGRAVIAVSHDIGLAARFGSRMIVMQNGKIAADGCADDLIDSGRLQSIFNVRFCRAGSDGAEGIAVLPL